MSLNTQQQAAKDFCLNPTNNHLNLIARAGCGKTYTLIEIATSVRGRVFVGAFNRSIADELKAKIGNRPGIYANTMHGAGLGAWRRWYKDAVIEGDKVRIIARSTWAMDYKTATAANMLVGYAKQSGLGLSKGTPYEDVDVWEGIIDHYDVEDDIPTAMRRKTFLENCIWTYEQSLAWCMGKGTKDGTPMLDFNDMLLAPLYYKCQLPQYDWVLIDEAQDTSECRRRLAIGMAGNRGRVVSVGDDKQAIYGFAGASNNALDAIKEELGAAELPLNVTYRCPKAVVKLAQQWCPDFTAHESAPDGAVTTIDHTELWMERFDPYRDVILCRYTRPLAGIATTLRDRGIACVVEGQSAKALIALAEKWGEIPVSEFIPLLQAYEGRVCTEWTVEKDRPDKAAAVHDRCGTIYEFARRMRGGEPTTKDLVRELERVFNDQGKAGVLRLCTIHRSKGREWERVFLIGRDEYMPSKWATQRWQIKQEENLIYVAVTRAKRELVEVMVPHTEPGETAVEWWRLDEKEEG